MKLLTCVALLVMTSMGSTTYQSEIEEWRKQRETDLKADGGWLTVAGLFWLKEGPNVAGSAESSDIVLQHGPAKVGTFDFHNGKVVFHPAPNVPVTINGKAAAPSNELKSDSAGSPDQVQLQHLTMFVIHRGNRYAIRLKDTESKFRQEFTGLLWYPAKESYKVIAKFVPYTPARKIPIPNILGETEQEESPGYVLFDLEGQSLRLDPVIDEGELFFIFHDLTSGKQTYPPGRFLKAAFAKDGKVVLDFNKAYNPPCAFTPFATCPLPPKQNRLPIAIEAGELNYGHH